MTVRCVHDEDFADVGRHDHDDFLTLEAGRRQGSLDGGIVARAAQHLDADIAGQRLANCPGHCRRSPTSPRPDRPRRARLTVSPGCRTADSALIVSRGDENILESHRREIVVVFCDLRGYTAFTETAEPEEVLFLREYHGALGPLVSQFEGTLDQFSGGE
jgi:hypothetical protein